MVYATPLVLDCDGHHNFGVGPRKSSKPRNLRLFRHSGILNWGNVPGPSLAPRIPPMAIVHADLKFAWGASLLGAGPR
jgi:hypothetical protein